MSFVLPGQALANNTFLNAADLDAKFAAIETLLNGNIINENIDAAAAIDASKIGLGGAVLESDVTTTGEADKIPKFDSNARLVVNRIIFKAGV